MRGLEQVFRQSRTMESESLTPDRKGAVRKRGPVAFVIAALLMFIVGPSPFSPCLADEIVVTSLIEGVAVTLRDALVLANTLPNGPHTIIFDVEGTYRPTSELPHLFVDGTEIRGEQNTGGDPCPSDLPRFTLLGDLIPACPGLYVEAHDCVITGLEIRECCGPAIYIHSGKTGNQIGTPGPESCERVYLYMNGSGITVPGSGTDNNVIRNCRIFENQGKGVEFIAGPSFNRVGVDQDGERNYIYANGTNGVRLVTGAETGGATLEGNVIDGNYVYGNCANGVLCVGDEEPYIIHETVISQNHIGRNEVGFAAGNNVDGVRLRGASPRNYILDNLIVDNDHNGITLMEESDEDSISGNFIGVLSAGGPMGNHGFGIYAQTDDNTIGPNNTIMYNGDGSTDFAGVALIDSPDYIPERNELWESIISANEGRGVIISGVGTSDNVLLRDYIGTDAGNSLLGNVHAGVVIDDSASVNFVRKCVIGDNGSSGVRLLNGAYDNRIYVNHIGTDELDTAALPNVGGVTVKSGGNRIGGTGTGMGNTICNNNGWGIRAVSDERSKENYIVQNLIGTNAAGDAMGNTAGGVWLGDGMINNEIGDWASEAGAPNVIMYNGGPGVKIGEAGALETPVQNRVLTNRICQNAGDPIVLVNGGNDMLPPPEVYSAFNAIMLPGGDMVGVVSGSIGYTHPPDVITRIQIFYDTSDECCLYYGHVSVSETEDSWTLQAEPLPSDARVYATETTKGPNDPAQPRLQTSGVSDEVEWGWWQHWNDWCDGFPCPWLGTEDLGRSVSWIDFDNDGLMDLFICNANSENRLLRNVGDGSFEAVDIGPLVAPGASSVSAAWADADNDGDQDVYLINSGMANQLFRHDGEGVFVDVTPEGMADDGLGRCAAWADYDSDGDLDVFLTNFGSSDLLYHNEGGLIFSINEPVEEPGWEQFLSVGAAWGDCDNDGDPDLYIVISEGSNLLLRNDQEMGFVNVTSGPLGDTGQGRGVIWGDFHNDGLLDLYLANYDGSNRLLRNLGGCLFEDATVGPEGDPGPGRGVSAGDFDLDGDLDLYVANDADTNVLLLNDGSGQFSIIDDPEPMPDGGHFSCPLADYDLDGDVDLMLVEKAAGADNTLLTNLQTNGHHWLHVNLNGLVSNEFGVGARIEVTTEGQNQRNVQIRQVSASTGSLGQDSMTEEFGLGDAESAALVRVVWPSGRITELYDVAADEPILIDEPDSGDVGDDPQGESITAALLPCTPNPGHPTTRITFTLAESDWIQLQIYDAQGRLLRSLAEGTHAPGRYDVTWDGRDLWSRPVPAGTYFLNLTAGTVQQRRAITLIR